MFSGSVFGQETEVKKKYHDSGKLWSEFPYKNGKLEGLKTVWNVFGTKLSETHYKNGIQDGLETTWHGSIGKGLETTISLLVDFRGFLFPIENLRSFNQRVAFK